MESLYCNTCHKELDPIGNVSYGNARISWSIRKWTLISVAVISAASLLLSLIVPADSFVLGLPLMHYGFYGILVIPMFLLTTLIPNTTKINCHHCGRREEYIGNIIKRPSLPRAKDATPTKLEISSPSDVTLANTFSPTKTTHATDLGAELHKCGHCSTPLTSGNLFSVTKLWVTTARRLAIFGYPCLILLLIFSSLIPPVDAFLTSIWPRFLDGPLFIFLYFPVAILTYLLTSLIPKTTTSICHKCGNREHVV